MRTFFALLFCVPMVLVNGGGVITLLGESRKDEVKVPAPVVQVPTPQKGWKDPLDKSEPSPAQVVVTPPAPTVVTKAVENISPQGMVFRWAFFLGGAITLLGAMVWSGSKIDINQPVRKMGKPILLLVVSIVAVIAYVLHGIFALQWAFVMGAVLLTIAEITAAMKLAKK